jgi:hypothetical protein
MVLDFYDAVQYRIAILYCNTNVVELCGSTLWLQHRGMRAHLDVREHHVPEDESSVLDEQDSCESHSQLPPVQQCG